MTAKRTQLCLSVARDTITVFEAHRGVLKPPVPVEELAGWLGFQVVTLFSVPDEFSALVSTREKLIGINGKHHRHRQRFSLCHELAHVLLKHPPEARCTGKEIALFNFEADECGAELLVPRSLLSHWLGITRNPNELARVFDVSVEALVRRIKTMDTGSSHPAE